MDEIDVDNVSYHELHEAIDKAGSQDQDHVTWLVKDGRRIAAIVPAEMANYARRHGYFAY